jgi:hypothetical protein
MAEPSIHQGPPDGSHVAAQGSEFLSQYEFEQLSATGTHDVVCLFLFFVLKFYRLFFETSPFAT